MTKTLHTLCPMCQHINFNLHGPNKCQSLRCEYAAYCRSNINDTWPHSQAYQHYSAFLQLQESASRGCHLCTLLETSISCPPSPEPSIPNPKTTGVKIFVSRSVLQVAIEGLDMLITLDMEDIPDGQWAGGGKERVMCKYEGTKYNNLLVVQSQHRNSHTISNPDDPEKIDSVTLVRSFKLSSLHLQGYGGLKYTYLDLFDVLREEGDLWLARKHGDIESLVGWIPKNHHVRLIKPPHASCRCGKGVWESTLLESCDTAYADDIPGSEAMIAQCLLWISHCDTHHQSDRCTPPDPHLPLRVIDVGPSDGSQAPFLSVGKSRKGKYATLSYQWGSGVNFKLTHDSLDEMTIEIPMKTLPKTLQHAIEITRRLGLRYIWIDALCIIQDREDDWLMQSSLMHQIYSDGWLNISADRAESVQAGFLQERNLLSLRSCAIQTSRSKNFSNSNSVVLPRHRERLEGYLDGPFSRGWIFQERHFSRRILHFGEFETSWECHYGFATEKRPLIEPCAGPRVHHTRPNFHLEAPYGTYFANSRPEEVWWTLQDWYKEINLFTYTRFKHDTDKLSALCGLAKVHGNWLKGEAEYFAGIWKVDFRKGLAWRNASAGCIKELPKPLQAASKSKGQCLAIQDITAGRRRSHEAEYIAPSFSWASVNFPIHYNWGRKPSMQLEGKHLSSSRIITPVLVEVHTQPRGDVFGQILDGWIRIRGLTMLYSELLHLPHFRDRESDAKNLVLDNGHHNPDPGMLPSGLVLLLLDLNHGKAISNREHKALGPASEWQAIVLTATGFSQDEYQRVGYFAVTENSDSWDISVIEKGLHRFDVSRPAVYTDNYFAEWKERELKIV